MAEERIIKFIWDYHGDPAERTAAHHSEHLTEFIEERGLEFGESGFEHINGTHHIAYILLKESDALELKDILRPHKAVIEKA